MEPAIPVDLPGVQEASLGNLGRRAAAARIGALDDPLAIERVHRLGLLPYFQREQVHGLIARIAERLPGSMLVFDAVPAVMLNLVRRASGRERDLAVKLWTWLLDPSEHAAISAIPGVEELRDLAPPLTRDPAAFGLAALGRLPSRLGYSVPVIAVLQARFRAGSAD